MYISKSYATAPFRVVMLAPYYCAVSDALLGYQTYSDASGSFETLAGAQWRVRMLDRVDEDGCPLSDAYHVVRDAEGRTVVADPEPLPAPTDDLPF